MNMKKLIILLLALLPLFAVSQITFPNSSKQQGKKLFMGDVKFAKSVQIGLNGPLIDSTRLSGGVFLFYKAGVAYNLGGTGGSTDTTHLSARIDTIKSTLASGTELSGLVPLKADSNKTNGNGYATTKYVTDHSGTAVDTTFLSNRID